MKVAISSGHGLYVRGASGFIDEVDEARKVVPAVARYLRARGVRVETFNDDTSKDQETNLETIVDWHNNVVTSHDLDVSVHFNSYDDPNANGTEVLWVTQESLAAQLSDAIADAGDFFDRGAKYRDNLYVLNNTNAPCVLIEVCFVSNKQDTENYEKRFDGICEAIANVLADSEALIA